MQSCLQPVGQNRIWWHTIGHRGLSVCLSVSSSTIHGSGVVRMKFELYALVGAGFIDIYTTMQNVGSFIYQLAIPLTCSTVYPHEPNYTVTCVGWETLIASGTIFTWVTCTFIYLCNIFRKFYWSLVLVPRCFVTFHCHLNQRYHNVFPLIHQLMHWIIEIAFHLAFFIESYLTSALFT